MSCRRGSTSTDSSGDQQGYLLASRLPQPYRVEGLDDTGLEAIQNNFELLFNLGLQAIEPEEVAASTFTQEYTFVDFDEWAWVSRTTGVGGANATVLGVGSANPTATSNATITATHRSSGIFSNFITPAGPAGAVCSLEDISLGGIRTTEDPIVDILMATPSSLSNLRMTCGIASATAQNNNTSWTSGGDAAIAFRYDPVAGDTGWVGCHYNSTGNFSTSGVVAAVAVSTVYHLTFRVDSTNSKTYFSVNGGTEVELSTNFPVSTVTMSGRLKVITTDVSAKSFQFGRMRVRFGTKGY